MGALRPNGVHLVSVPGDQDGVFAHVANPHGLIGQIGPGQPL